MQALALLTTVAVRNTGAADTVTVDWSGWGQAALLAFAIFTAAAIVRIPSRVPDGTPRKKFAAFIRQGVIRHTEALKGMLGSRLQENPANFTQAQGYLRTLRKDLRNTVQFIARVDKAGFGDWPDLDLFNAFHDWAEPIRGMDRQLEDMLRDLDTAAESSLVGPLLEQFRADAWRVRLDLSDLDARSKTVVETAEKIEK